MTAPASARCLRHYRLLRSCLPRAQPAKPQQVHRVPARHASYFGRKGGSGRQQAVARRLESVYDDLTSPSTPPSPSPSAAPSPLPSTNNDPPTPASDSKEARAAILFGSRLAGPAARRRELDSKSTLVAGVLVPPRPEEPDNCCMSGCVNCVWDQYRDELEEWAGKSAEAKARMRAQSAGSGDGAAQSNAGASSMDDDGGGSEALWGSASVEQEDLFANVPVGIREFMRNEKMLRERKRAVAAAAA